MSTFTEDAMQSLDPRVKISAAPALINSNRSRVLVSRAAAADVGAAAKTVRASGLAKPDVLDWNAVNAAGKYSRSSDRSWFAAC